MDNARKITEDITILPSYCPLPGLGMLPINAFVINAAQPVLVDTGMPADRAQFLDNLRGVIDPADLRWIWLTHPDPDHVGSLMQVLEEAPQARLVTTYLGFGMLSLFQSVPPQRAYLLNPGESLDAGDRRLVACKPPTFDNPATTGFFDTRARALFSSDSFGALLQAPAEEAAELDADTLREGQVRWTTVDAPWLHKVDMSKFAADLTSVRDMEAAWVLSSHLPPAQSRVTNAMLENLATVPGSRPFVGPNQAAMEAMMAGMLQAQPA